MKDLVLNGLDAAHPTSVYNNFQITRNLRYHLSWSCGKIPAKPIFWFCGSTNALTLKEGRNHSENKKESAV